MKKIFKNLNLFEIAGFLLFFVGCLISIIGLRDFLNPIYLVDKMKEANGVSEIFPSFVLAIGYVIVAVMALVFIVLSLLGKGSFKKGLLIILIISLVNLLSFATYAITELSNSVQIEPNYAYLVTNGIILVFVIAAYYFDNPKQLTTLIIYSVVAVALIAKDIIQLVDSFDVYFIFEMIGFVVLAFGYAPLPFNKKAKNIENTVQEQTENNPEEQEEKQEDIVAEEQKEAEAQSN